MTLADELDILAERLVTICDRIESDIETAREAETAEDRERTYELHYRLLQFDRALSHSAARTHDLDMSLRDITRNWKDAAGN